MINVLICAFQSGINGLASSIPEPKDTVNYFISWQGENIASLSVPSGLANRSDVKLSRLEGKGLARNRNNCIKIAKEYQADGYFLIADEDVDFLDGFENQIENAFATHSDADLLCFQVKSKEENHPFKNYPLKSHPVSLKSIDRISSIEIAGKMEVLDQVRFDERLGLGADFPSGEETAFLADCIRSGKRIIYCPVAIVSHPFETSGKRRVNMFSDQALQLVGGRSYRIYGPKISQVFFFYSAIKNFGKYRGTRSFFSYLKQLHLGVRKFKNLKNG
ncbi:glycosyltransferase family 2 protein [Algoriphagus formosus]|uniref:hypothetical protein n=1 Tax=Algoriphagus formosus TaxID=2007308 RepID=UPI000C28900A|nr:hypothetical protein [Algoriphagus formosus]